MQGQNQKQGGFVNFITQPGFAQGLIGAGDAIMNSGYGGNIAAGFKGFDDARRAEKQRQFDNAYKNMAARALLARSANSVTASSPSSVREYNFYNKLSPKDQKRFLNVKRATLDKGITYDNQGQPIPIPGYDKAIFDIKRSEQGGKEDAKLSYADDIEENKMLGKDRGEKLINLGSQEAKLPQLMDTVDKLSNLGKKATYTYAGQALDFTKRQAGLPVGEGATSRAEYISIVDNQVLPLLRDTFGAAFTKAEGDSLRATLGDPNASPEEKDARLRSFIDQKVSNIESLKREVGQAPQNIAPQPAQKQNRPPLNDIFGY